MKTGETITLKTYEELSKTVDVYNLTYRDILGQEVKIKEVLKSQKADFYGVILGGQTRYLVTTKAGSEFLIYPEHLINQ